VPTAPCRAVAGKRLGRHVPISLQWDRDDEVRRRGLGRSAGRRVRAEPRDEIASVSGPRELLSTTKCPAFTAGWATVLPTSPLPMNPIRDLYPQLSRGE
jgi:hypothetical protein